MIIKAINAVSGFELDVMQAYITFELIGRIPRRGFALGIEEKS